MTYGMSIAYITSAIGVVTFSATAWQEIGQIADTGRWFLYSVSIGLLIQESFTALIPRSGTLQWRW
jgi:hypothetical protein